ncbi:myo-inositol 2-dehydrogenase/D-chiro-inositol 1-dehydrogenase [Murinocardiopsis flavida]|uniref:Myo-inositol 2-dehydrogenase/D-chiro-inositol 1-dehydrogenase n=1 Tax=Murinocardiopsis flavida TaxID=645275 RepID=A0A2P8DN25_9ACTN|nr:Gfo/Idh/MocA family oxidoreductase [Murinocardiopsis flavida]PSK98605.1 myo-inositol 2-dehydrogenase/D-chiro-inositol 1-dehydrogenase [Murinocardiopsis flavida]
MRVGLVGTGRIGAAHAAVVAAQPAVTELVLADADAAAARAVAEPLGASVAEDPESLLAPGAVDALVVTASTSVHAGFIVGAVRAGIPVFCEKPVAPTLEATVEVAREVEKAGVPVHIGFQRRFDSGYTYARQALRDGHIGQLHRVHLVTADRTPPPAAYVPTSGGLFRDCHIHDFDILRWVTGREVVEVTALGANRGAAYFVESGDVDNSAALLVLDDATLVTVQGSRYNGGGYDVRMELAGSDSTIGVGYDDKMPIDSAEPGVRFPGQEAWDWFWPRFAPAYEAEMLAFLRVAAGEIDSPCDVAEALEAVLVAEAADLSMRERRPVRIAELRPA